MEMESPDLVRPPKLTLSHPLVTESDTSISPPFTRDSSPSPSISPSRVLYPGSPLSRSFSATPSLDYSSSASTISQPSVVSRSSSASTALRQRGYVRPQGSRFAPSAGNRDSVMSLGSIAHLQYYFARTGLLEGKGGRASQDERGKPGTGKLNQEIQVRIYDQSDLSGISENGTDNTSEAGQSEQDVEEPCMLPPTVSTYNHRVQYIAPPPDSKALRRDLETSLADAKKALQQVSEDLQHKTQTEADSQPDNMASSGWHEIQGMHILDVVTLAIRAAKIYYTSHEHPQRLYSIKSDRKIRQELMGVLDTLKRMAGRNFSGGTRVDELATILGWVNGIETFIVQELELERTEAQERSGWQWLDGDWQGREREREWHFLNSFHAGDSLPEWTPVDTNEPKATPFLEAVRNGLTLVHLHNALLKKSKRQFGEIKTFHTDTAKPYRCAENLRYWIKAAEIRWEVKLTINVSAVANARSEAWTDFDAAIQEWSRVVREELTKEWRGSPKSDLVTLEPKMLDSLQIDG